MLQLVRQGKQRQDAWVAGGRVVLEVNEEWSVRHEICQKLDKTQVGIAGEGLRRMQDGYFKVEEQVKPINSINETIQRTRFSPRNHLKGMGGTHNEMTKLLTIMP